MVTIANQKGGVGKTTTLVSLGAELASRARVLLLDLDPQANATSSVGVDPRSVERSSYDLLVGQADVNSCIVPTGVANLDLIPATSALAGAQIEIVGMTDRERLLDRALAPLRAEDAEPAYEVVLIDTPPSLGLLTLNALAASEAVIVPVQCEYLALEGLSQLLETIQMTRESYHLDLTVLGIILTMFDPRTNLSEQVADEVRKHFPEITFRAAIPRSVRLSEAPSYGQPIQVYDRTSRGAQAYGLCAMELMVRLSRLSGRRAEAVGG
ncbi:MAG: ParA family protein [Chloroflexota bacterium]